MIKFKILDLNQGIYIHDIHNIYKLLGLMSRMFVNGPGDQGSIPGRVIPKTQKMVLDALSTIW